MTLVLLRNTLFPRILGMLDPLKKRQWKSMLEVEIVFQMKERSGVRDQQVGGSDPSVGSFLFT